MYVYMCRIKIGRNTCKRCWCSNKLAGLPSCSFSQNLRNLKNLPRSRPPGAKTFLLMVKSLSKPRSKLYEPCLHIYQGQQMAHRSTWAYLSSYLYRQPRPQSDNAQKASQNTTPEVHDSTLARHVAGSKPV